jgi:hypothetical protein
MKRISITLALTFITLTSIAYAGYSHPYPVQVFSYGASGALTSARYSSDGIQEIGCQTYTTSGTCFAEDSSYNYKSCATTDSNQLAQMRSVNATSYVYFTVDSNGNCGTLFIMNSSQPM